MMTPAADKLRLWREHPEIFVREVFGITPDPWQDEALKVFPHKPLIAMKACAGPGKTALLVWIAWNFLLTRPHPKIVVTAISGENLKDNFWAETAKWQQKSPLLLELFEWNAERITSKEFPSTWWMSARKWSKSATPEQQGNTLRGLHDDYVMAILDESGGIPQSVMSTAENIGSSAIEWHILQAGNPTHLEGPLYTACTTARDIWHVIEITADPDDPLRTPRVSVEWAKNQIKTYGRDHPYVLVNVMGKFPPASFNALIGPDEVTAALGRHLRITDYEFDARTMGVDVADFGDDRSVIFPRQGLAAFTPAVLRNTTPEYGAGLACRMWTDGKVDAAFIDNTGGWASGWKVVARNLGRSFVEVDFAGKANDPTFFNKRTEIVFEACRWIKDGGSLPAELTEIVGEFTTPTYTFKGDKFLLEPKEMIKARLGRSPDLMEALAVTFAQPVKAHRLRDIDGLPHALKPNKVKTEFDPWTMQ